MAVNFRTSAGLVMAWMNSPKHRENILKSDYTDTGIGIDYGIYKGKYVAFVVQHFGTLKEVVIKEEKNREGNDQDEISNLMEKIEMLRLSLVK